MQIDSGRLFLSDIHPALAKVALFRKQVKQRLSLRRLRLQLGSGRPRNIPRMPGAVLPRSTVKCRTTNEHDAVRHGHGGCTP